MIRLFVLGMMVIGLASCTDNFTALNSPTDRLTADQVGPGLVEKAFAKSQYMGMFGDAYYFQQAQNLFGDMYAQYFAVTKTGFDSDQYVIVNGWVNTTWSNFYQNAAPELFFVENYTAENGMDAANAIAKIWRVQIYHRMTDYWGPIIYSQFGNGQTHVPYDSQEEIYKDFFRTLDEAVAVLQQHAGEKVFAANDLLFDGDVDKWRIFANSLRLRLAVRLSYVNKELAKQEAEKAVQAGVMTDNSDNADLTTTNTANARAGRNPYGQITQWGEFRASAAMISALKGYNDPRIDAYYDPAVESGEFVGLRNGVPKDQKGSFMEPIYSDMDLKYLALEQGGSNPDMRVMHASEVYFLRAEGALRGWSMGGTDKELYEEGIRASLKLETGATDAEVDAYLNSDAKPVALNDLWNSPAVFDVPIPYQADADEETRLEQIITQKWIALYPDGWEAWTERRRTNYPKLYPLLQSLNPDIKEDEFPRRVLFVTSERQNNSKAVDEAVEMLGGSDNAATRLWWDAK